MDPDIIKGCMALAAFLYSFYKLWGVSRSSQDNILNILALIFGISLSCVVIYYAFHEIYQRKYIILYGLFFLVISFLFVFYNSKKLNKEIGNKKEFFPLFIGSFLLLYLVFSNLFSTLPPFIYKLMNH